MLHQDNHPGTRTYEIHGASHSLHHLAWNHPICDVTIFTNLERAKHGYVQVTASNHAEGLRRGKIGASGVQSYSFLSIF